MSHRSARVKDAREARRHRIAQYRKEALTVRGLVYNDLARTARVTYSMADKWANARRASQGCEAAFVKLTGVSPYPPDFGPTLATAS